MHYARTCKEYRQPVAQQDSEGPWFNSNLGTLPFPLLHFPLPLLFLSPALPTAAKRPPNPARGLGKCCKLPSRIWGGTPAEIEFDAL